MKSKFAICALAALTLTAAGCSGSSPQSSSAGAGGGVGGGATSGTGLATSAGGGSSAGAPAALGGLAGQLDVTKLCAAVKQADVQKLFKDAAPTVMAHPGECDWGSGAVTLDIYPNDSSKQYYNGGGINIATATPLSGVGDEAAWSQPVQGATVPVIAARKGSTTCTITAGLNVDQTAMSYTGTDPFYKIDPASAARYAAEEGQLCNEIFAAGS